MAFELRLQRVFDAPPEVVFDTLLDPETHAELYAPEGWSLVEDEMDLRVGGAWTMVIAGPDGERHPITYVFTEIERPHRLVATMSMVVGGRTVRSTIATTLEDRDGKTVLTLVQGGFETEDDRDTHLSGASPFLDALQRAVSSRTER